VSSQGPEEFSVELMENPLIFLQTEDKPDKKTFINPYQITGYEYSCLKLESVPQYEDEEDKVEWAVKIFFPGMVILYRCQVDGEYWPTYDAAEKDFKKFLNPRYYGD